MSVVLQTSANSRAPDETPACNRIVLCTWDAPVPIRVWHLASLDAPTVAVVWASGFAWAARIRLPAWAPILLALVAWAVYIGDRLLDARAGLRTPPLHHLRDRHHFHWRHRRILIPLSLAAALASAWIVLERLPAGARAPDSLVGAATLAYFSGIHSRRKLPPALGRFLSPLFSREFLVGSLFTAGCMLPVWSQSSLAAQLASPHRLLLLLALFFSALAWLNCRAIGHWESSGYGPTSGRISFAGGVVGITGLLLAVILASLEPRAAALLAAGALSALLLALLDLKRDRIEPLALRSAADLVLLTPLLLIPLGFLR
jgi:hypothetical protein